LDGKKENKMDSNIEEEIDSYTSDTEPLHKVKLTNDGTLVKIENTNNPNPLVLRLRYRLYSSFPIKLSGGTLSKIMTIQLQLITTTAYTPGTMVFWLSLYP